MTSSTPQACRRRPRDPAREQFWRESVKQFLCSGQSVHAFCIERGLAASTFYFWRGEIQRRDAQVNGAAKDSEAPPLAFAKVLVRPAEASLCLRLSSGRELLLPASWTPEQVVALLRALEVAA